MTPHIYLLTDIVSFTNSLCVCLSDGTFKLVIKIGKFSLSTKFVLIDVLYVPEFTHNLISVSKALETNNLHIILNSHSCIF